MSSLPYITSEVCELKDAPGSVFGCVGHKFPVKGSVSMNWQTTDSCTHTHALHLQSSSSSFKRLVLLLLRRRRRLDDCYDGEGGARVRNGRRARS